MIAADEFVFITSGGSVLHRFAAEPERDTIFMAAHPTRCGRSLTALNVYHADDSYLPPMCERCDTA